MIRDLGLWISRVFGRYAPDPFVLAILLTVLTAVLALALGDFDGERLTLAERGARLLDGWRSNQGIWAFLAFSMQMCLVLVTGHALAATPPVRRAIAAVADLPRSTAQAAAMIGIAACAAALLNWGFGLIVGAVLARDVGRSLSRRGAPVQYPLLVAAGYSGMMVWHGGLSGSAPLSMTTIENARKVLPTGTIDRLVEAGLADGLGLERTLFSPLNLVVTGGLLIIVPLVMYLLAPCPGTPAQSPPPEAAPEAPEVQRSGSTPAERLDHSRLVSSLLGIVLLVALVRFGVEDGLRRLGLNEVVVLMLGLGLLLHRSPRAFALATEDAARGCAGIIIQFPLYAGIMAMMVSSGLVRTLSGALVDLGGPGLLPLTTFVAAGVVNLFVPSGGGQWGVQGPLALGGGLDAGIDAGTMVMAVAYGDQLTNMLQPFWALPLLAITGARARDIVGYSAVLLIAGGAWFGAVLFVMG